MGKVLNRWHTTKPAGALRGKHRRATCKQSLQVQSRKEDDMADGNLQAWRELFDSPQWTAERFTQGQAWIDLVGLANHEDGVVWVRNEVEVNRGQLCRSEPWFVSRWSWTLGRVKKFFMRLESEGKIERQNSRRTSVITIINYEAYQEKRMTESEPKKRKKASKVKPAKQPPIDPKDIAGTFPVKGDQDVKEWFLTKAKLAEYVALYAGMDVRQECKKAKQWLTDNPERQKTARGMTRYLNSWLERSNNRGNSIPRTGGGYGSKQQGNGRGEQGTVTKDDLLGGGM